MKHILLAAFAALLAACGSTDKSAPAASSATAQPAATMHTKDIISARQDLMTHIEQLIIPIDGLQVGDKADAKTLKEHAELIAVMLAATPHLFPPDTNLYDPAAAEPATLAMPAIWQNVDAFYAMAGASATAAREFAKAEGKDAQLRAGAALRGTCDACHAPYLRPFKPATMKGSEAEVDVDSLLK